MIDYILLSILIIYFAIVLYIGKRASKKVETLQDYSTAGASLSKWLAIGTMCATFVSSATIIGGAGYSSQFGWSFPAYYGIGTLIGITTMMLAAKKLRESEASSLGDFIYKMYGSKFLQVWVGIVVVAVYALNLIIQLFAIGYIIQGLVGIPMFWGILFVGIVFVIYTVWGGLVSVAKTDLLQWIVMSAGVLVTLIYLGIKLANTPGVSLTSNSNLNSMFTGPLSTWYGIITFAIVFGVGIGTHPYYFQRCFAAKDVKVARTMLASGAFYGILFFIAMAFIGVAGVVLFPDQAGDGMLPYLAKNVLGVVGGGLVMIALIAGIQSTTDSLLHVVGVGTAIDVYAPFKKDLTDEQLLKVSRIITAVFGLVIVVVASIMALQPLPLIAFVTAFTWGVMGSSLYILVYGTIFWKRATVVGAIGSSIGGFFGSIIGRVLYNAKILPFNEIYLSIGIALVLMIVLSLLTKPREVSIEGNTSFSR